MTDTDAKTETDTFVINMKIEQGSASVASCEVVARHHKHKIVFRRALPADEVLAQPLVDELKTLLGDNDGARQVYSSPDFHLALPRLILGGLRVVLTELRDGVQYAFIRFRHFIGGVADAFRVDLGLETPTVPHRERIAVEALVDIVGPWLDILRDLKDSRPDAPAQAEAEAEALTRLQALSGRSEELRFYMSLLMSYVEECRPTPRLSVV